MLNQVTLQGRIGKDLDLRQTTSGTEVIEFSLAVGRDYSSSGNPETDWITVVAWRETAKFISRNFSKGKMIIINGRLQTRSYTTNDGSKRNVTEVIADKVYFAGDKAETTKPNLVVTPTDEFEPFEDDDTLPF